jgi:hypothetical protein
MATNNAINNTSNPLASSAVTIDPGASGDSYIQYNINTANKFRLGVDDNASDSFKISVGNALGSSDVFVMTANGECTLPQQPAFFAYLETGDNNVTGQFGVYELGNTGNNLVEYFDRGSNLDHTTGVFTAPVTGQYFLHALIRASDIASGMTTGRIDIRTKTGASFREIYSSDQQNAYAMRETNSNSLSFQVQTLMDLDAADTAYVYFLVQNGAGDTVDIVGNPSTVVPVTLFSGYLAV